MTGHWIAIGVTASILVVTWRVLRWHYMQPHRVMLRLRIGRKLRALELADDHCRTANRMLDECDNAHLPGECELCSEPWND